MDYHAPGSCEAKLIEGLRDVAADKQLHFGAQYRKPMNLVAIFVSRRERRERPIDAADRCLRMVQERNSQPRIGRKGGAAEQITAERRLVRTEGHLGLAVDAEAPEQAGP
jgi:NADPH:quinone reductase-like Zn-dependent oxidoreductase